jgi:tetratricopeptide (TPR) repeat protein
VNNLRGNSQKAIAFCNTCLQCELDEWERISCLTVYAEALRSDNRFKDAEAAIEEAFRYARNYKTVLPNLYLELGLIQYFTKHLRDARQTFQQTLAVLDTDPYKQQKRHLYGEAYRNLRAVCFELEEYSEASASLKDSLSYSRQDNHNFGTRSFGSVVVTRLWNRVMMHEPVLMTCWHHLVPRRPISPLPKRH